MFKPSEKSFSVLIVLWLAIVACSIVNLLHRPTIGYYLLEDEKPVLILPSGAALVIESVEGLPARNTTFVRMAIDSKRIGQHLTIRTADQQLLKIPLIAQNRLGDLLINLLPALFFLLVGLWIRRSKAAAPESYLIWAAYLFGLIIAISWDGMGHSLCGWPALVVFYLSYPLAFAVFFIYSFYFPNPFFDELKLKKIKVTVLSIALLIGICLLVLGLWRYVQPGERSYLFYQQFYRAFRVFTLLLIVFAFANMFYNFKKSTDRVSKLRFYWVAGGMILGSFPFIFLWSLPQIFNLPPLIPEWLSDLFLIVAPLSVVIAILKYRLFDIEVVLSRSLTYLFTLSLLLLGYVLLVGGLSWLVSQNFTLNSPFLSVLAAVIVALSFNPLRSRVQKTVDQKFFIIRYDQFRTLQRFLDQLSHCSTVEQVGLLLEQSLQSVLPLTKNQFVSCAQSETQSGGQASSAETQMRILLNRNHLAYFEIATGEVVNSLPEDVFVQVLFGKDWRWLLGSKQNATRFWREDLELIEEFARSAMVTLEKIRFWQQALKESAEKEAARQLSSWKSLMVSAVAHNFNGPLNSLLWKLNTLNAQQFDQKKDELQQQIDRLQNMVRSLLNLAALESGQLQLQLQSLLLAPMVKKVSDSLSWQRKEKNITLQIEISETLMVKADPVLAEGIIQNILENAFKYSPSNSSVSVRAVAINDKVCLTICDEGPGIPEGQKQIIFTPFARQHSQQGLHLGLYMSRQFVLAMNGEIEIKSGKEGAGTCVDVILPSA